METVAATHGTYTKKGNQMKSHPKHDKIHEALELLNQVAHEKKDELWETITEKYTAVKDMLHEATDNGLDAAIQIKKDLLKKLHEEEKKIASVAHQIDKKVHKEPWKVIGGVAAASLIIGALWARRK